MIRYETDRRTALAALTHVAEPANPLLGVFLSALGPCEALAAIGSGALPSAVVQLLGADLAARAVRTLRGWQERLSALPPGTGPEAYEAQGIRLVCPGDPGWPARLDDLGLAVPYALWVRGSTDLQSLCQHSVAVVGSRAATVSGRTIGTAITVDLTRQGWMIISGGAFGIDACAHSAALACGGQTVAVLACGPDQNYPREHEILFHCIARRGAIVSEYAPGTPPSRQRFLRRNQLIAALACGTLVVEAAVRSGSLVTARRARTLNRPLMAVPGPESSAMSAGCNQLIREHAAVSVTGAADVIQNL